MGIFYAADTFCASCGTNIATIEYCWPGLGLICANCHQAVLRPTLRPTPPDEVRPRVRVGPAERHEFRLITIGSAGKKVQWWQCPTCFGIRPVDGGHLVSCYVEAGRRPRHPKEPGNPAAARVSGPRNP